MRREGGLGCCGGRVGEAGEEEGRVRLVIRKGGEDH